MTRPGRRRRPLHRLRRQPAMWWLATAALAGATGFAIESSLARAERMAARYGNLTSVPVVSRPVGMGQPVLPAAVRMERRPRSLLPRQAPATAFEGRVALVPLVPGEVVLASKLAPGGLRGAAALLPPGTRALAVPGGPGGSPPTGVGDRVDVLATFADGDRPTVVVAAGALVVGVDSANDNVTVAVQTDEAPQVAFALATATVVLALTSP